jgi:hypothetical protein
MDKLVLLYKVRNATEASIIKGMLEENNIPVFVMNKQDSSYLNFGDIEIYVDKNFKDIATQLLNQALRN